MFPSLVAFHFTHASIHSFCLVIVFVHIHIFASLSFSLYACLTVSAWMCVRCFCCYFYFVRRLKMCNSVYVSKVCSERIECLLEFFVMFMCFSILLFSFFFVWQLNTPNHNCIHTQTIRLYCIRKCTTHSCTHMHINFGRAPTTFSFHHYSIPCILFSFIPHFIHCYFLFGSFIAFNVPIDLDSLRVEFGCNCKQSANRKDHLYFGLLMLSAAGFMLLVFLSICCQKFFSIKCSNAFMHSSGQETWTRSISLSSSKLFKNDATFCI